MCCWRASSLLKLLLQGWQSYETVWAGTSCTCCSSTASLSGATACASELCSCCTSAALLLKLLLQSSQSNSTAPVGECCCVTSNVACAGEVCRCCSNAPSVLNTLPQGSHPKAPSWCGESRTCCWSASLLMNERLHLSHAEAIVSTWSQFKTQQSSSQNKVTSPANLLHTLLTLQSRVYIPHTSTQPSNHAARAHILAAMQHSHHAATQWGYATKSAEDATRIRQATRRRSRRRHASISLSPHREAGSGGIRLRLWRRHGGNAVVRRSVVHCGCTGW